MMGYTKFGEFVRILRVQHHQIMADMADILGTTTPFLSAVENGRKNVPKTWFNKISDEYRLTGEQKEELKSAIEESKLQVKLDMKNADTAQRKAALQFARSFEDIDEETAIKIIELLEGKNDA